MLPLFTLFQEILNYKKYLYMPLVEYVKTFFFAGYGGMDRGSNFGGNYSNSNSRDDWWEN